MPRAAGSFTTDMGRLKTVSSTAWTPQKVRERIQVGLLLKLLSDHASGKIADLSKTRLKAIEILLKKSLPDLSSVDATLKGDANNPIVISSMDGQL